MYNNYNKINFSFPKQLFFIYIGNVIYFSTFGHISLHFLWNLSHSSLDQFSSFLILTQDLQSSSLIPCPLHSFFLI